jgi:drug/metabolite transporter (DMT)-like permease
MNKSGERARANPSVLIYGSRSSALWLRIDIDAAANSLEQWRFQALHLRRVNRSANFQVPRFTTGRRLVSEPTAKPSGPELEPLPEAPSAIVTWPSPDGFAPLVEAIPGQRRGGRYAALVVLAVSLFSLSDVFAKQLSQTLPPLQIVWIRYALFMAMALIIFARSGARLRSHDPLGQALRGVLLLLSALFFILALRSLPVAEATAISFVGPVFITLLAVPLLREVVGVRRWTALGISLAGVLVVVRPGAEAFQPAALLPVASAFSGAVMAIVTRKIGARDANETTLVWSSLVGLALLTASAPWWWVTMGGDLLWPALAMGGFFATGQYALVIGYSRGDASMVAPFSYAQVLVATALGAIAFGDFPDAISLVGIGLVVLSGAYTLYREGVLPPWRRWPQAFLRSRRKRITKT